MELPLVIRNREWLGFRESPIGDWDAIAELERDRRPRPAYRIRP